MTDLTRTHLIGVGGVGMAAVAELLAASGSTVSGSDARATATLDRLRGLGIDAYSPHRDTLPPGVTAVVVSTAVRPNNPELLAARAAGIPVLHRSEALAALAEGRRLIAVAGAHGKTSTSSMLAITLKECGMHPSYAIGGEVIALGTGAHLGSGDVMVAEADESDGSFLNYRPLIAIVTNVEPDHLDHFGSREAFEKAFEDFSDRIRPGGLLIACADDEGSRRLAERRREQGERVVAYGLAANADARVRVVTSESTRWAIVTIDEVDVARVRLTQPGTHQALNATAAWLAAREVGADPSDAAAALGRYTGARRRFEFRGEAGGVRVIDDYAHHPTEIAAVIAAAKERAGSGRVIVLFQPHLYSRTLAFAEQFADALSKADEVVVTEIYGAREDPIEGVSGRMIVERMHGAVAGFRADRFDAARAIALSSQPGDLILTLGAGNVTETPEVILATLERI